MSALLAESSHSPARYRVAGIGESGRSAWDSQIHVAKCPLYACDLNRSMQHLHSSTGKGDVENEAKATSKFMELFVFLLGIF